MCVDEWKEWKFEALTDIWTGDADQGNNRLIPTGLLGSIRWWFEVLVRGLGGKACDPTDREGVRCPSHHKRPVEPGHHCVVCELFGCADWARKFRLMVLDENGQVIQDRIRARQTFVLRFIPLRPIRDKEWCLLCATLRLIAEYGAIGGKTVFKPSEEWGIADLGKNDLDDSSGQVKVQGNRRGLPLRQNDIILEIEGNRISSLSDIEQILQGKRHGEPVKVKVGRSNGVLEIKTWAGKRHHQDFGLVNLIQSPQNLDCSREQVEAYVRSSQWRTDFDDTPFAWASLQNFWYVKGRYLARQANNTSTFNRVIGRPEQKDKSKEGDSWLAGSQQESKQESKKVFSFKNGNGGGLTYGFVKPGLVDFEEMKNLLKQAWPGFQLENEFQTGEQIVERLFQCSNKEEGA